MAAIALEHDTELMLRVKSGDAASFASLLARQRGPVIHFLYRMVGNQSVAEELAQEVFLRVYRARASYEPAAKFTTWSTLVISCRTKGRLQMSPFTNSNLPDCKP